mmetsp:Transcript_22386/g.62852  ORF Transcript_22386/g.62852 Transcript_22386/m.62852 type:complete len:230 (-) Transcript_22386:36-725(-)
MSANLPCGLHWVRHGVQQCYLCHPSLELCPEVDDRQLLRAALRRPQHRGERVQVEHAAGAAPEDVEGGGDELPDPRDCRPDVPDHGDGEHLPPRQRARLVADAQRAALRRPHPALLQGRDDHREVQARGAAGQLAPGRRHHRPGEAVPRGVCHLQRCGVLRLGGEADNGAGNQIFLRVLCRCSELVDKSCHKRLRSRHSCFSDMHCKQEARSTVPHAGICRFELNSQGR